MSVEKTTMQSNLSANTTSGIFLNNLAAIGSKPSYDIAALKSFFELCRDKFDKAMESDSLSFEQGSALKAGADKFRDAAMQLGLVIDQIKSDEPIDKKMSQKVSNTFAWAREGAKMIDDAKIYGPPSIYSSVEMAIANARQK